MRYVPKPQAPVTAVRASKDYTVPKGHWLVISESGNIQVLTDESFKHRFQPESEAPAPAPPKPAVPKPSPRRAGRWNQAGSVLIQCLHAVATAQTHGASLTRPALNKILQEVTENYSARIQDLLRKDLVYVTAEGTYVVPEKAFEILERVFGNGWRSKDPAA